MSITVIAQGNGTAREVNPHGEYLNANDVLEQAYFNSDYLLFEDTVESLPIFHPNGLPCKESGTFEVEKVWQYKGYTYDERHEQHSNWYNFNSDILPSSYYEEIREVYILTEAEEPKEETIEEFATRHFPIREIDAISETGEETRVDINLKLRNLVIDYDKRQAKNAKLIEREKVIEVLKWANGYYDFPERQEGEGAFYWRKHLRKKFKEIGIEINELNNQSK